MKDIWYVVAGNFGLIIFVSWRTDAIWLFSENLQSGIVWSNMLINITTKGEILDFFKSSLYWINLHFSFPCPICAKTFFSNSSLNKHKVCHDPNRIYECAHCPKSYWKKFQIRNHLLSVHIYDNVEPSHECPEENCGKKFLSQARLKHHVVSVASTSVSSLKFKALLRLGLFTCHK